MAAKSTKQGCPVMTTSSGRPVGDNQNSVTAGPLGPVLMEDYLLAALSRRGLLQNHVRKQGRPS